MKTTAFVGANARVRVYESRLLQNDQYERMLQAPTFREAVAVLNDTPYRDDVDQLLQTGDYDELLTHELQRVYEEMFEISPEPALVGLFSLRYAYHNLKVMLKEKFTGEDFSSLIIPIGRFSLSTYRDAVWTGRSEELDPEFLASIAEVERDYAEYQNIQAVDIILDRRYFTHLRHLAEKIGDQKIIDFIKHYIDLNNLSTLSRAISQKRTRNFLITILSSSGSIPKEELVRLGNEDLATAGKVLLEGKYGHIVEEAILPETQELSPVRIDLATDNAIMNRLKDAKLETFGPLPILAYLYAKETEVKNIRMILAGKENQLGTDRIRERMRENYGS
ncbi:V-type ATP synthase subunit C [Pisciglobus halotolerans]|uniref:V/A-type H+-transporting ATPase subunit C n=1 Tax=Pisciglobus halotolerans TaxID=745365 RepID=A0A1I3BFY9_9LACT|nr:V-type ATP synthase subunit C [Pisciglobus halotolerans]SFH61182.1 V/A-type H+-transporting ATPase subunit C [Pisciglobus halotolerans]